MRKCIGCGEMKPKKEMLRIVRTTQGDFVLDASGKANGRGAYICRNKECLLKAIQTKGLERSFKQVIPEKVYESLKKEMDKFDTE